MASQALEPRSTARKMRTCFLLLTGTLLAAAATTQKPPTVCPPEVSALCPPEMGEFPELYAYPDDCSKFCKCSLDGLAWEYDCPGTLLWDDELKTCNYPENVDCGTRPVP
ncbi:peritrophin-1 isoform X2 [Cherax quadricarinatus]|uniref:peritrophin-1 isoform X2 n=1 Tax=Cherax quadricarinatus TaxID=27406 RepID=UPI002379C760|nr:peritrophin-1-like isoform X2 [Cherax quadricarinatus]